MPIVPVPPIRDLGTVPNNNMDEATFNVTAEAFTSNMPPWGGDVKAVGDSAKTNADFSFQMAVDASEYAGAAADRLVEVQAAANGAFAAANYKGEWSTLTGALNVPATVTHLGRLWYLKVNLANVTSQPPALGSTYWGEVSRNDFAIYGSPAGTTNAVDRGMYRMSSGSSVLQLPSNPFHGMVVAAVNVSGTLTPYIQRNGKTICGDAEDYTMNQLGWQIVLQYDSTSGDWLRVSGFTAFTPYSTTQPFGQVNVWTAAQNFGAGASFGDGKVLLRKTITVTAPAFNAGATGTASTAHGLTYSKIRTVTAVAAGATFTTGPEYGGGTNIRFSHYVDPAVCVVVLVANQGQDVAGRPVYFNIEYEA